MYALFILCVRFVTQGMEEKGATPTEYVTERQKTLEKRQKYVRNERIFLGFKLGFAANEG